MAKYTGSLVYKGAITEVDGDIIVVEQKKVGKGQDQITIEEPYNLSEKLRNEYVGRLVSISIKEDTELEPIESME